MSRTTVITFGYDHGEPPSEAEHVYDLRGMKYNRSHWDAKAHDIANDIEPGSCVAIGCKHGRTRSVAVAKAVQEELGHVKLMHRDKHKQQPAVNERVRSLRQKGMSEADAIRAANEE